MRLRDPRECLVSPLGVSDMKTMVALLCGSSLLLLPWSHASTALGAEEQPSPSEAEAAVRRGTFNVVRVDRTTGTLVLEEPEVGTLEMRTGPGVPLAHVERGQQLEVTYYPEVALALERPGHSGARVQPAGVASRQPTLTEGIVAVDTLGHTVTLRAPSGRTQVIHVTDPRLQAEIEGLRSGEHLQLTYSEALAVSVAPAD
jgi:hypothetical protein